MVSTAEKRKARVESLKKQYLKENVLDVVIPQVEIDKTEELIQWTQGLP